MGPGTVEDIELRLFLEALQLRYGYDLRAYARASMHRRVHNALSVTGHENLGALQHAVLTQPDLLGPVIDCLTVQVSEMFRDPECYRVLRTEVVPYLRAYPQLRVWHAGCAAAEEVYSMAILLIEEGLYERSQLFGTDLSLGALERATEAVYPARRAATFATNYAQAGGREKLERYWSEAYERVALLEHVKRNVWFFQHNAFCDHTFGEMQVVFCRNLLIYLSAEAQAALFTALCRALCHGGFLVLGNSESPPSGDSRFEVFARGAHIYRHWKDGSHR